MQARSREGRAFLRFARAFCACALPIPKEGPLGTISVRFNSSPQGVVSINSCTFRRNGRTQRLASNTSFAGGIHLEFSEQVKTNITIQKCKFYDNMTPRYDAKLLVSPTDWNGNSIGGGMCVALLESTSGVNIQIMNSIFHNNNANWVEDYVFTYKNMHITITFLYSTQHLQGIMEILVGVVLK